MRAWTVDNEEILGYENRTVSENLWAICACFTGYNLWHATDACVCGAICTWAVPIVILARIHMTSPSINKQKERERG